MEHIFITLMEQLTALSEEEKQAISSSFEIKTFDKGYYLLKEGQIARNSFYIIEGCVREFSLIDGEENTSEFFTENDSVANFDSLANHQPSEYNLVCLEPCKIVILNAEKENQLYLQHPRFESFCRAGMEEMLGKKHKQLANFIRMKPEQRYLYLLENRPALINRVPHYQLASYLGIKPETLSRIRRRIIKK